MAEFKNLFELLKSRPTEQDCIKYYEKIIWKGKIISPFDPDSKVYKYANNRYRCKNTEKYFNVKTGTIFENSKIPLQKWFRALYFLTSNKKGITSLQLAEEILVTQKTAWFVLHRLRKAFEHPNFIKDLLENNVEIDETFIGGKNKNRHKNKKIPNCQGRSAADKTPVLGIIERGGNLITQVIPNTQYYIIEPIIKAKVKEGANISTDEWPAYNDLNKWYNHEIVNHRIKQYVNGKASTNAIENVWSHLKRTLAGIISFFSRNFQ